MRCGYLIAPEDHAQPSGRTVRHAALASRRGSTFSVGRDPHPVLGTINTGLTFAWSAALDAPPNRAYVSGFDPADVPATTIVDLRSGAILRMLRLAGLLATDPAAGRLVIATASALYTLTATTGAIVGRAALHCQATAIAVDTRAHRAIVLCVHGHESTVVVVATTTGALVHATRVGAYTGAQPGQSNVPAPIVVDAATGRAFVTDDRAVSMFDTRRGVLLRTIGAAHAALALDDHTNHLYVLANNTGTGTLPITVLDAATGLVLRRASLHIAQRLGDAFVNAVAVDEATHRLFLGREGGYYVGDVLSVDTLSGRVLSTHDAGSTPITLALDMPLTCLFVAHQNLWNSDDNSPRSAGSVDVVNAATGAVRRRVQVEWVPSQLLQDPGAQHLIVLNMYGTGSGSSPSSLSLLSETALTGAARHRAATGTRLVRVRAPAPSAAPGVSAGPCPRRRLTASPLVRASMPLGARYPVEESFSIAIDAVAHRAYIPSSLFGPRAGRVRILDTCTGALISTVPVAADARLVAVDVRQGRVLVVHVPAVGPGLVSILEAHRGTVVQTVRVGVAPSAVAVDALTGNAFVATQDPSARQGALSTIDVRRGRIIHTALVGAFPTQIAVDTPRGLVLVVSRRSAAISVVDARTGRVRRTVAAGDAAPRAVALDRPAGLAVIAGLAGIHVLTVATGRLQRLALPPGAYDNVAVDERRQVVLIGCHDDRIRLLRLTAAPHMATVVIPAAQGAIARILAVDAAAGLAFVGTYGPANGTLTHAPGAVTVLATGTGRIVGTIRAGFRPSAAVDSTSGLLFVLDGYANQLTIVDVAHLGAASAG